MRKDLHIASWHRAFSQRQGAFQHQIQVHDRAASPSHRDALLSVFLQLHPSPQVLRLLKAPMRPDIYDEKAPHPNTPAHSTQLMPITSLGEKKSVFQDRLGGRAGEATYSRTWEVRQEGAVR